MEENILLLNQLFEEAGLPLTEAQSRAFLTVFSVSETMKTGRIR